MTDAVYQLNLTSPTTGNVSEHEFIVASLDEASARAEAERIANWYAENLPDGPFHPVLADPIPVNSAIYTETSTRIETWANLSRRVKEQHASRPRGVGCIFRGGRTEEDPPWAEEDRQTLEESIRYLMEKNRESGPPYLFLGSRWNKHTRLRIPPIHLFEAAGIRLAADIAQLHFLGDQPETVLIDWACQIYGCT